MTPRPTNECRLAGRMHTHTHAICTRDDGHHSRAHQKTLGDPQPAVLCIALASTHHLAVVHQQYQPAPAHHRHNPSPRSALPDSHPSVHRPITHSARQPCASRSLAPAPSPTARRGAPRGVPSLRLAAGRLRTASGRGAGRWCSSPARGFPAAPTTAAAARAAPPHVRRPP